MMRSIALAAWFALLAVEPALANCATRHFYNNSGVPWVLAMGDGSCSIGAVNKASECYIPPGQTADIHYANANALNKIFQVIGGRYTPGSDEITIQSNDRGLDGYQIFPVQKFKVKIGDLNECYIKHDGNTGLVVLNEPAHGDVQTCRPDNPACRPHPSVKPTAQCAQDCMMESARNPYKRDPRIKDYPGGPTMWQLCKGDCEAIDHTKNVDRNGKSY